jgi:hypothetical protein
MAQLWVGVSAVVPQEGQPLDSGRLGQPCLAERRSEARGHERPLRLLGIPDLEHHEVTPRSSGAGVAEQARGPISFTGRGIDTQDCIDRFVLIGGSACEFQDEGIRHGTHSISHGHRRRTGHETLVTQGWSSRMRDSTLAASHETLKHSQNTPSEIGPLGAALG